MILLDTNVLIYAFDAGAPMHKWARATLRSAILGEGAAINTVILSELLVGERSPDAALHRLEAFGVHLLDLPIAAAARGAQAYRHYLENRSQQTELPPAPKTPLPDFLIGAHASVLNSPIATADTVRYQRYFPEVQLLKPA